MVTRRSFTGIIAIAIVAVLATPAFARGGSSGGGGGRGGSVSSGRSSSGGSRGSWGGSRGSSSTGSRTVSSNRWSGRTASGGYHNGSTSRPAVRTWYSPTVSATKSTVMNNWGRGNRAITTTTSRGTSVPSRVLIRGVETGERTFMVHENNKFFVLRSGRPVPVTNGTIIYPNDFLYTVDSGGDEGCDAEAEQECDPYDVSVFGGLAEMDETEIAIFRARKRAEIARAKRALTQANVH